MVGTARCAVPARVQRAERTLRCERLSPFVAPLNAALGRRSAPSLPHPLLITPVLCNGHFRQEKTDGESGVPVRGYIRVGFSFNPTQMSEFTGGKNRSAVRPKNHLLYFAIFYRAIIAFAGGAKRLASGLQ